ncbi:MAG TPA: hypothetical protein VFD84_04450 [Candidatus Binatia bacterium]|jgi:hypothetical protein|nr:hypothetical protein [Candidatus Binatia bacterium]
MAFFLEKRTSRTKTVIVRVDGELVGEATRELRRLCHNPKGRLRVDLRDLRRADDAGIAAIHELEDAGAEVIGASPYIALLLVARRTRAPAAGAVSPAVKPK